MLDAHGVELVTRLRSLGYRGVVLTQFVDRAFPNALDRSKNALINYADNERAAINAAYDQPVDSPIRPPVGQTNASLERGIHYTVILKFRVGGGPEQRKPLDIPSSVPLSWNQILDYAQGVVAGTSGLDFSGRYPQIRNAELTELPELIRLQRGSG